MATMGKEESHRCREVAIVERFKQESVYDLSAQKNGHCRDVAVSGVSTVRKTCFKSIAGILVVNLFLVFTENTQPIAFILHQI